MILETLRLEDVFCYSGIQEFDLTPPGMPGRNILIIHGRNSYGKTSFLNALKLLFGGVTTDLRSAAVPNQMVGVNQYIVGDGTRWLGVFNRRGLNDPPRTNQCSIHATGRMPDGRRITINRDWQVSSWPSFTDSLSVEISDRAPLQGEDAQLFLDGILPRYAIPYYIYDGELVQQIAADDQHSTSGAVERLLDITPLETLRDQLKEWRATWAKEADANEDTKELNQVDYAIREAEREYALLVAERERDEQELKRLDAEISRLESRMEFLRSRGNEDDHHRLAGARSQITKEIERIRRSLAEDFLPDAIVLFNQPIIEAASNHLQEALESGSDAADAQNELLQQLHAKLPADLFDRPPYSTPPLLPDQSTHYKTRLSRLLQAYMLAPVSEDLDLSPAARRSLIADLRAAAQRDADRRRWLADLKRLADLQQEQGSIDLKLEEIGHLSETERAELRQTQVDLQRAEGTRGEVRARLTPRRGTDDPFRKKRDELRDLRNRRDDILDSLKLKGRVRRKMENVLQAEQFAAALVDAIRRRRRNQVQESIDQHFHEIFSSNDLIRSIELLDDFRIRLRGLGGTELPKAHMSAGTKQMLAIALLWALKDASKKEMPVVIDTPLARLDRQHQDHLLTNYFPNIARQVIILPTNSEIDERKYQLISPHIYREYKLDNPGGLDCRPIPNYPMYDISPARSARGQ